MTSDRRRRPVVWLVAASRSFQIAGSPLNHRRTNASESIACTGCGVAVASRHGAAESKASPFLSRRCLQRRAMTATARHDSRSNNFNNLRGGAEAQAGCPSCRA
jgi:hypothetical protein